MTDNKQDTKTLPLKERKEEILALARRYIKLAEEQIGTELKEISKDAEEYLLAYNWPGDEKDLELAVKKACILSEGPALETEDFELKHRKARSIGKFVDRKSVV